MKLAVAFVVAVLVLQCVPESESKPIAIKQKLKEFIAAVKVKVGLAKDGFKKYYSRAKAAFKNSLDSAKKKVKKIRDKGVQGAFDTIYENFEKARDLLEKVSSAADEKFEKLVKVVEDKFYTVTSQIEKFTSQQEKQINKKQNKQRGSEILNQFVETTSKVVSSCSDLGTIPIRALYEKTKNFINGIVDKLESIIRKTEECLLGQDGVFDRVTCFTSLALSVTAKTTAVVAELTSFKSTTIASGIMELLNIACIATTRLDVERRKSAVEGEIRSLK